MIELRFPLTLGLNGSFESTTSYEQIWKQRVIAAISTAKGSRVMRPRFGASLGSLVFMNSTDAVSMAIDYVGSVFNTDLKDLTLEKAIGVYDEENRSVTLDVRFRLPNKEEASTIVFVNTEALAGGDL